MEIWDILSIGVLVLTACIVGYFVLIFFDPNSSLNVLPPTGPLANTPTNSPAPIKLEPTWTASPTLELTPTRTLIPTWTPIFTSTPFSLVPATRTPKPSATPKAPFTASVSNEKSTLIYPDLGCNWSGIGGMVVDANNTPMIGIVVVLRGSLNGNVIDLATVSGVNKAYGPSGFEFVLGNAPVSSTKTLYVQLVDQSNIPLSDPIYITTSSDCSKNLVLVRFKKRP
jgi:hypothetical protein